MAEFRTRAIVLRTFDQGESDRLVHLYTEALGRVSAIAKGARRSRRRFPGTLEILSVLDTRIVDPSRSSLLRLEGARLERPFERLVNDLGRYAISCMFLEILDRFTGEHESNPELFHFALGVLDVLAQEDPDRLLALLVLTKTLAHLGYRPQFTRCSVCGTELVRGAGRVGFVPRQGGAVCCSCAGSEEARVPVGLLRALEEGIRSPLRERGRLALSPGHVRRAELLLDRFFRFHIGIELKSGVFLRDALGFGRVDATRLDEDTAPAEPGGITLGAQSARRF